MRVFIPTTAKKKKKKKKIKKIGKNFFKIKKQSNTFF